MMRVLTGIALFILSSTAFAATNPRAGEIEYSAALVYSFSDSLAGNEGSSIDFSSRTGFRVGLNYFFSSKLSAGFDATWIRPNFNAVLIPDDGSAPVTVSHRSSIFTGHFSGAYYLLENDFTPYIEGGLGWTFFDSNVSDSPPVTGCWWDPWWGYICSDFYSTYSSTNFSYGADLGLRWNVASDLAINLGYRWLEIEADDLRNKPTQESAFLEVAYRF